MQDNMKRNILIIGIPEGQEEEQGIENLFEKVMMALAGVAQWTERRPGNPGAASLIPGWGTCLGCGPGPWLEACERQPTDVSLSHRVSLPLFLPPFPYL